MNLDAKIFVAGHRGLVGSAILQALQERGYTHLVTRTRAELDLLDQAAVRQFFLTQGIEYVFLAAARVGGIQANKMYPAQFIQENLTIQTHVIHSAHEGGVKKLLFMGSSCTYPEHCPQPMQERHFLSGPLEANTLPYAVAKIAGITMCQAYAKQYGSNFISLNPANLYGLGDNWHDLQNSHVLPALIRKVHTAKTEGLNQVEIWGDGTPSREFLFADDLADACIFLMNNYDSPELINVGSGEEITIADLAHLVADVIGYKGEFFFNAAYPNGTPRKLMDPTKLQALGWKPRYGLRAGLELVYRKVFLEKA